MRDAGFYGVGIAETLAFKAAVCSDGVIRCISKENDLSVKSLEKGIRNFRAWHETRQQLGESNMKKLFWVAVLYHGGKNRKKTEVVQYPQAELYKSEDAAREAAIAEIPANYKKRYDRLEVVVRPF